MSAGVSPNPLHGTGYASEHGNFLCLSYLGQERAGDSYPLPCVAAREREWRTAPILKKFVITAWWPPTMNVLDAYADAHFNVLLGGNIAYGCQLNRTMASPGTATEAFECIAGALPRIASLGLKFIWGIGNNYNVSHAVSDAIIGGSTARGGISDNSNFSRPGYITAPEIRWLLTQLRLRNLSDVVEAIELHDDITTVRGSTAAAAAYLRRHAPTVLPVGNAGYGGATTLYEARMPIASPEEYAIAHDTRNATRAADMQLSFYATNQMSGDRFRLDTWPLFNLGDNPHRVVTAPTLVRVQAYGSLAYGARGLFYYCWGNGIWRLPNVTGAGGQFSGRGEPTTNYETVKRINADAAVWGTTLLSVRHVGAIRSERSTARVDFSAMPADDLPVTSMDAQLLVGAFATTHDGNASVVGYLMVVDLRLSLNETQHRVPPRRAKLRLHPACAGRFLPGGQGGWAENTEITQGESDLSTADHGPGMAAGGGEAGGDLEVGIAGGGGALIELIEAQGQDVGTCRMALARVRRWWFDPRRISLRPPDRGTKTDAPVTPKDASSNRFGAGRRHFAPGGLAGYASDFLLGGSYWESAKGWESGAEARAWAEAGLNAASLPSSNSTALVMSLGHAMAFGLFVFAQQGALTSSMEPLVAQKLCAKTSCHPNLMGLAVATDRVSGRSKAGSSAWALEDISTVTEIMRTHGYWMVPFSPWVSTVSAAIRLAHVGVPLAAVALPAIPSFATSPSWAGKGEAAKGEGEAKDLQATSRWAAAVLSQLESHAQVAANTSLAMTMAVGLDACRLPASDSMLRFAAYASVLWGAQALWWEGIGACAPLESPEFALIGAVNARLAQWAAPLFMLPRSYEAVPWRVAAVFSTSSLLLPPLQGHVASRPGTSRFDLIQHMDADVVAVVLANATTWAPATYKNSRRLLLFLSTRLSPRRGGASPRRVGVRLRSDVASTRPIEPDGFQGFADLPGSQTPPPGLPPTFFGVHGCELSWVGDDLTMMELPGGGMQLLSYTLAEDWQERTADVKEDGSEPFRWVGRSKPPTRILEEEL